MPARHFTVTGLVQGVFFRATTQQQAQSLGLAGWVRNCDDGSVEVHAEGSAEALDALEAWLHEGPPAAEVTAVQAAETAEQSHAAFTVTSD